MNELTQKLIFALVVLPILIGIFRGAKEMSIVAGAVTVALFFANIDKFSRFKGGGIEAELHTAVKEALFAGLDDGQMDGWDKSKLEQFIEKNGLKKNGETEEWLRDLDYFLLNHKLRREAAWQS